MRRAFVTGAYGLVGRWLVEALLARGVEVVLLRRTPGRVSALALDGLEARCTVVPGALADPAALARGLDGADTVVHLAAQSVAGEARRSPVSTFETNVRGTWLLLEACGAAGAERVVVASSDKVYGPGGAPPHAEDAPLAAQGAYGASKAAADLLARELFRSARLPVTVARLANVYGPGDLERSRLVPELVGSALAGRPPRIDAGGTSRRDFVFAPDAAAALLALAGAIGRGAEGEAFNVGAARSHTVGEVAAACAAVAGGLAAPDPADAPPQLDSGRLRSLSAWAPRTPLAEGLRQTLDWHRAHPRALDG